MFCWWNNRAEPGGSGKSGGTVLSRVVRAGVTGRFFVCFFFLRKNDWRRRGSEPCGYSGRSIPSEGSASRKALRQGSTWLVWGWSCRREGREDGHGIWKTEGTLTVWGLAGHGRILILTPSQRETSDALEQSCGITSCRCSTMAWARHGGSREMI